MNWQDSVLYKTPLNIQKMVLTHAPSEVDYICLFVEFDGELIWLVATMSDGDIFDKSFAFPAHSRYGDLPYEIKKHHRAIVSDMLKDKRDIESVPYEQITAWMQEAEKPSIENETP